MSVLSLPRVILNGTVEWNPATNNNQLQFGYNKDPVTVALPSGITYETFDNWLIEFNGQTTNGDWNVYGQMQTWLKATVRDTKMAGPSVSDPLVGASLNFHGGTPKLVDVNPYSAFTSQIFLDQFGVSADGGIGFHGPAACRMTSRRPFMARNIRKPGLPIAGGMGVVWQTVIHKDDLTWEDNARESPVLAALQQALEQENSDDLGLMLRVAAYTTRYFTKIVEDGWLEQTAPEVYKPLADKYAQNTPIAVGNIASVFNPAVSSLTGAIGLWKAGELMTVPSGRVMAASSADTQLGPVDAEVDKDAGMVSFDMLNTVPETNENNTKVDVGTFSVVAKGPKGTTQIGKLGPDQYSKDAYESGGGMVDIAFDGSDDDWANIQQGVLSMEPDNSNTSTITQQQYYADTDERGVYLEQDSPGTFTLRVFEGDAAPTEMTELRAIASDRCIQLTGGSGTPYNQVFDVKPDGTVTIGVTPIKPGSALVLFAAYPTGEQGPTVPRSPSPTTGYTAVRVMSFDDDLANIPGPIEWPTVYEHALRPFDLVYRGMSAGVFQLGSEASMRAHASSVEQFTDPGDFESPLYMPVTRDMSRGRRKLLMRFLKGDPPTS